MTVTGYYPLRCIDVNTTRLQFAEQKVGRGKRRRGLVGTRGATMKKKKALGVTEQLPTLSITINGPRAYSPPQLMH